MISLLFVCMGNICRSPAAEGVLRHQLRAAGLEASMFVDSAGTLDYHTGSLADPRMRKAAGKRGIALEHRARQIRPRDLQDFDMILVMDAENEHEVRLLDSGDKNRSKIQRFCTYCTRHSQTEVPDPYLGTADDFELVLDILEDGCAELVRKLKSGDLQ